MTRHDVSVSSLRHRSLKLSGAWPGSTASHGGWLGRTRAPLTTGPGPTFHTNFRHILIVLRIRFLKVYVFSAELTFYMFICLNAQVPSLPPFHFNHKPLATHLITILQCHSSLTVNSPYMSFASLPPLPVGGQTV